MSLNPQVLINYGYEEEQQEHTFSIMMMMMLLMINGTFKVLLYDSNLSLQEVETRSFSLYNIDMKNKYEYYMMKLTTGNL